MQQPKTQAKLLPYGVVPQNFAFLEFKITGKILSINLNCTAAKIFFLGAYDWCY